MRGRRFNFKPGAQLRFEDMADESIIRELDKKG